jgi:hypothetical protein
MEEEEHPEAREREERNRQEPRSKAKRETNLQEGNQNTRRSRSGLRHSIEEQDISPTQHHNSENRRKIGRIATDTRILPDHQSVDT